MAIQIKYAVSVAAMTSQIQDFQKYMQDHPRNKHAKIYLKELIDKRKKYLRLLRNWDYRRFEWILERLNLVYKPLPRYWTKLKYPLLFIPLQLYPSLKKG